MGLTQAGSADPGGGSATSNSPSSHSARHLSGDWDVSPLRLAWRGPGLPLRHSEHAHLLSDIEKLTRPILGTMFPFWSPTEDLVCQLEATST